MEYIRIDTSSSHGFDRSFASLVKGIDLVGELLLNEGLTLGNVHVVSGGVSLVDLTRSHNLVIGVFDELRPVSKPSCKSGESEEDGEHLSGDAESLVDNSRVEVNVRVELSLDEVLIRESNLLKGHSNINHRFTANNGEDIISNLADDGSSGVKVLVDSVSKTLQHLLAVLHPC